VRWRSDYKWVKGTILAVVHMRGTWFVHCDSEALAGVSED